ADLVALLIDGNPVLGIIVEVQLQPDRRKRFSWPVYVTGLRARLECPCCLLVVTASENTATWAQEPIPLGPGAQLVPLVVAPNGIPIVTDPERAMQDPELAVLSVMAHGHGDVSTALKIALSAVQGTAALDEDTRVLYFDLIEAALSEAARKAFEMLPQGYQFQGPTFNKGKLEGRAEGKAEGQAQGMATSLLEILDARGFSVTDDMRESVQSSTDLDQLRLWIRRAAVIQSADELFDE